MVAFLQLESRLVTSSGRLPTGKASSKLLFGQSLLDVFRGVAVLEMFQQWPSDHRPCRRHHRMYSLYGLLFCIIMHAVRNTERLWQRFAECSQAGVITSYVCFSCPTSYRPFRSGRDRSLGKFLRVRPARFVSCGLPDHVRHPQFQGREIDTSEQPPMKLRDVFWLYLWWRVP